MTRYFQWTGEVEVVVEVPHFEGPNHNAVPAVVLLPGILEGEENRREREREREEGERTSRYFSLLFSLVDFHASHVTRRRKNKIWDLRRERDSDDDDDWALSSLSTLSILFLLSPHVRFFYSDSITVALTVQIKQLMLWCVRFELALGWPPWRDFGLGIRDVLAQAFCHFAEGWSATGRASTLTIRIESRRAEATRANRTGKANKKLVRRACVINNWQALVDRLRCSNSIIHPSVGEDKLVVVLVWSLV